MSIQDLEENPKRGSWTLTDSVDCDSELLKDPQRGSGHGSEMSSGWNLVRNDGDFPVTYFVAADLKFYKQTCRPTALTGERHAG